MMQSSRSGVKVFFEAHRYTVQEVQPVLGPSFSFAESRKFFAFDDERLTGRQVLTFSYTGFITTGRDIVCVLPKYLGRQAAEMDRELLPDYLDAKARLLLRVLEIHELRGYAINDPDFHNYSSTSAVNELALAKLILEDYQLHGLWFYSRDYSAVNGDGEINWQQTTDYFDPVQYRGVPYYFDVYTQHKEEVYTDLVTQIHRWAVVYCSGRYSFLLGLSADLNDEVTLEELGDPEYLTAVLERELSVTFREREILLLQSLIALLRSASQDEESSYTLYGHSSFEHVWEDALQFLFRNDKGLSAKIPHATWKVAGNYSPCVKDSPRPDILRVIKNRQEIQLLILDAKYYLLSHEGGDVQGNPGVPDVVKQYFYEIVLSRKSIKPEWSSVVNAFGFPSLKYDQPGWFAIAGTVSIENDAVTKPVVTVYFHTDFVFDRYTDSTALTDEEITHFAIACRNI